MLQTIKILGRQTVSDCHIPFIQSVDKPAFNWTQCMQEWLQKALRGHPKPHWWSVLCGSQLFFQTLTVVNKRYWVSFISLEISCVWRSQLWPFTVSEILFEGSALPAARIGRLTLYYLLLLVFIFKVLLWLRLLSLAASTQLRKYGLSFLAEGSFWS